MGCGKSFTAKVLAEAMNWNYVDMDDYLEEKEGCRIKQIFATQGEAFFRQLEHKYLKELLNKDEKMVISAGGGTPCFFDNMRWINEKAVSIYLKTPIAILVQRLKKETEHRPLIAGQSEEELNQFIAKKLKERTKYYEQASVIYHVNQSEEDAAGEILKYFFRRMS